jgi:hypothetical protein
MLTVLAVTAVIEVLLYLRHRRDKEFTCSKRSRHGLRLA